MPNRIIKESICTSENLNNLTPEEESLFLRLTVKVDDYGRYDARPAVLRAACYPLKLDKVKKKDIERWLVSLERETLIIIYWHNNKPYLYITTWREHQRVRANKSKYPEPTADNRGHLRADDSTLPPNAPVSVSGNVSVSVNGSVSEIENGEKQKHGKHVLLTPNEYASLVDSLGEQATKEYIERLDDYIEQIGPKKAVKYKSHFATIKNWHRRDQEKKLGPPGKVSKSQQIIDLVNSYSDKGDEDP